MARRKTVVVDQHPLVAWRISTDEHCEFMDDDWSIRISRFAPMSDNLNVMVLHPELTNGGWWHTTFPLIAGLDDEAWQAEVLDFARSFIARHLK
jgi:hypothetical protein